MAITLLENLVSASELELGPAATYLSRSNFLARSVWHEDS